MKIGIISDTHGTLHAEATAALNGVDHIIHAGDIGDPAILKTLEGIAPVAAVRGNTDHGRWAAALQRDHLAAYNGVLFYVLHDLSALDLEPAAAGIGVVVSGHTHRSEIRSAGGVMYFNPGSAGRRRHGGPLTLGRIVIGAGLRLDPEIVILSE